MDILYKYFFLNLIEYIYKNEIKKDKNNSNNIDNIADTKLSNNQLI